MSGTASPESNKRQRADGQTGTVDRDLLVNEQVMTLKHRPGELMRSLQSYVTFELGRRVRLGQIDYEDLLRDEVIDSAFASALTRLQEGEPIRDLHTYLRTRAQDMIGREVRRIQFERRQHVSLEQTISSGDETEGGEEVRVGDIIEDENARAPEQVVIDNETLGFMIDALSGVPDLWRSVFLQRTMQERTAREVADLEGLDIDEVRRITIRTRDYLRERFDTEYDILDIDE